MSESKHGRIIELARIGEDGRCTGCGVVPTRETGRCKCYGGPATIVALPAEPDSGLDVERLARALGAVGHVEGLHRWCKDVDGCGLYADGREFAADLLAVLTHEGRPMTDSKRVTREGLYDMGDTGEVERLTGRPLPEPPASADVDAAWERAYLRLVHDWAALCDLTHVEGDSSPSEIVAALRAESEAKVAALDVERLARAIRKSHITRRFLVGNDSLYAALADDVAAEYARLATEGSEPS